MQELFEGVTIITNLTDAHIGSATWWMLGILFSIAIFMLVAFLVTVILQILDIEDDCFFNYTSLITTLVLSITIAFLTLTVLDLADPDEVGYLVNVDNIEAMDKVYEEYVVEKIADSYYKIYFK